MVGVDRLGSRTTLRAIGMGFTVACLTAALAACGGGGDDDASAQGSPSGNQAPTISGAPATQAMQGQQYTFTPTASDANGDTLTFAATNVPAWATFNPSTGQLSGTPSAAQVGTYANIRISVSDGTTTVDLASFAINVVSTATGSATLTWNPPTQNTDGTALTNLAGYKVYWGTSATDLSNSQTVGPGLATYVVEQLTPATWYFAVSAVNSSGVESVRSNVASKTVF